MGHKKPVIGAFSSKYESAQATAPSPPNRLRYLRVPRIDLAFPGLKTLSGVARWRFLLRHRAGQHLRN
jgi:hypothetical protein